MGPTSQLSLAVSFLHQHPSTVLATVDVGFNDMVHCLGHHEVDEACVDVALANVRTQIPQILAALRAAGGPQLHIVGVGHYDPYLVAFLDGAVGEIVCRAESGRHHPAERGAPVGLCRCGYRNGPTWRTPSTWTTPTPAVLPDGEAVPLNVARTCALDLGLRPRSPGAEQASRRGGLPAHQRCHQRRGVKPLTGSCGHGPSRRARVRPWRSPVTERRHLAPRAPGSRASHDVAPASGR